MSQIHIIAAGRLKKGPLKDLYDEYSKRLGWSLSLTEIDEKTTAKEHEKIESLIKPDSFLFILDETGKSISSPNFADKIKYAQSEGHKTIQFVIGGADGLSSSIRSRANFCLSFGSQTWPHMMVRVMLIEQLYRAQQIIAGHPYHRA